MSKITVTTAEARANLEALVQTFNQLQTVIGKSTTAGAKNSKQLADELAVLEANAEKVVGAFESYRQAFSNLSKSQQSYLTQTKNLKKELNETNTQLKNMTKSQRSYKTQLGNSKKEVQSLTAKIKTLTQRLEQNRKQYEKLRSSGGVFSKIKTNVLSLVGAFGILSGIDMFANVIRTGFNLIRTLDGISFAMKATITDSEELAQTQNFLAKTTKAFGAAIVTTTNRYVKFRTAANQAGFTALETQKIFGTLTKVSGVLGLKTDELTGIYLALEQMISKGKITTEELRRQLGERLPGAMDIMATSMGVTTAQLDDMLKKGEVITKDVLPGFAKQVNIAFGLDSIRKVETLQAATTRLSNAWVNLVDGFRTGNGTVTLLREGIDALAENLGTVVTVITALISAFLTYKTLIIAQATYTWVLSKANTYLNATYLISLQRQLLNIRASKGMSAANVTQATTTGVLTTAINVLRVRLAMLWAVMVANPVGAVIALLGGLLIIYKALKDSLIDVATEENKLGKEALEANQAMLDQSTITSQLMEKYDALNSIAIKTTEQQAELKDVIVDLGKAYPGVITEVDKYGKALELNNEKLQETIAKERELIALQAEKQVEESTQTLGELREELTKVLELQELGVVIQGKGSQKIKDLSVAELQYHSERKANLLEQIDLAEKLIEQAEVQKEKTEELQFLETDQGKELSKLRSIQRAKEEAELKMMSDAEKERYKQTAEWIEKEIKLKKEALKVQQDGFFNTQFKDTGDRDPSSFDDANAKANAIILKEINDLQDRYNKLMGIEDSTRTKSLRKLKEIKDLQHQINGLEKEQEIEALNERINNEQIWYEDRKNAVNALADLEMQRSEDVLKDKTAQALAEYKTIASANQNEINAGASGQRREDLERNTADALLQKQQQERIATLEHNARIVDIQTKKKNTVLDLQEQENEDGLNIIEAKFSKELIALNEGHADYIKAQKANLAKQNAIALDPDASIRERVKAEGEIVRIQNDIKLKEENIALERAEIQRRMVNAIIEEKMRLLEFEIDEAEANGASEEFLESLRAELAKLEEGIQNEEIPILDAKKWQESLLDIIDIVGEFSASIMSIFDEVANARIEKIGAEIEAEKEKYDELIRLEEGNQLQQDLLARNRDLKVKQLEKKRLKEEQKQARIQKAMAIADIQVKLAQTLVGIQLAAVNQDAVSLGVLGNIYRAIQIPLAIGTAAAQTAAILAAPIPQFKDGGEIGMDLIGMINDGGSQEFVERNGQILTSKEKNAIVPLKAGDTVYKDYADMAKNSMVLNNVLKGMGIKETPIFDETIIEKAIENGFKKAKINNNINLYGIDADHQAYKDKMSNWN